jgi:hypothetical protein
VNRTTNKTDATNPTPCATQAAGTPRSGEALNQAKAKPASPITGVNQAGDKNCKRAGAVISSRLTVAGHRRFIDDRHGHPWCKRAE